jgi:transcriptional regulator with XRE-family HTH domain
MAKSRQVQFLKKVGLRVKQLRAARGITQEDFYNDTGIHVGRIETAQRDISMSTLHSICKYLEVTPEEFFENLK